MINLLNILSVCLSVCIISILGGMYFSIAVILGHEENNIHPVRITVDKYKNYAANRYLGLRRLFFV